MKNVILTNMILVKNASDEYLVLKREKRDWPGLTFPGGHVENSEDIISSAYRELYEETGLIANSLQEVGYFEWNNIDENRHLSILFYTDDYSGSIKSSDEGKVFFLKEENFNKYELSNDFMEIFNTFIRGIKKWNYY